MPKKVDSKSDESKKKLKKEKEEDSKRDSRGNSKTTTTRKSSKSPSRSTKNEKRKSKEDVDMKDSKRELEDSSDNEIDDAPVEDLEKLTMNSPKASPRENNNNNDKEVTGPVTRSVAIAMKGPNYLFYKNLKSSQPRGDTIDNIHKNWFGDYGLLEDHHGYIQWLFPVFESSGMNSKSSALTKGEAKLIREDLECAKRVILSYRLMLDFYGIRLVDEQTGELERNPDNYRDRYRNLNVSSHNNLRISRIIISLGELGFKRYKKPLVEHFQKEILEEGKIQNCKRSLTDFWAPLLNETSSAYIKKTKENPEDRTDSIFFKNN